jgi:hypothetical protein
LIDIYHYQENLANLLGDQRDAELWNKMLGELELQTKDLGESDVQPQPRLLDSGDWPDITKRIRLSPARANTM